MWKRKSKQQQNVQRTVPEFPTLPEGYFWRVENGPDYHGTTMLTLRRKTRFGSYVIVQSNVYFDASVSVPLLENLGKQLYAAHQNQITAAQSRGDYT